MGSQFLFLQGQLLDKRILVGDTRVPKFLICNVCNQRGHKASSCPSKCCT